MGECCHNKNNGHIDPAIKQPVKLASTTEKLINNLKSSIFCGTKGFLTFSLASLSWLEYSLNRNMKLKEGAAFAMKRNVVPFGEMIAVPLLVCFVLPAMVGNISLVECALTCAALMVATCFVVRTCQLRQKLMETKWLNTTGHSREEIYEQFKKDTMKFPIFNKNRQHIEYNSPNPGQSLNESTSCCFVKVSLTVILKALQSCIMLSLATVEVLEAVPSFCVDLVFDRSFSSTESNMQKSVHLLYANIRNLVPVTKLDECVANLIGTPKATCCGA
ncbi:hypothetical protein [Wolbachia endosymbiont (group B) of Gerris lacustris]|uniref:hypothetical protein n=1 Tax=Wolbachia endosymbiont (group B) of Gerris lacustris TaxID=3066159 RepID=UPI0033428DF4